MAANPRVVLETTHGAITIELYPDQAPLTVQNFLDYVDAKHYDGLVFHRVIDGFMLQGGGYDSDLKERSTRKAIKNESANGLKNEKYTLAMARTSAPDSATSQFFINVADNAFLDRARAQDRVGYCVFGKVVAGTEVVDRIKGLKTGRKGPFSSDVPQEEVKIQSARRAEG